ncbi:hypothetical protein [Hymenobacter crusticola]|uniref:hypothetical protein n=1 Tax=Hymenobacter crusticola TaxID=1770526 RepID=UPI00117A3D5A|nr:hypothetical protein [Hymenobacter crusticola]
MARFIFPSLFVVVALSSHLALAQQRPASSAPQAADPATTSTKPDNPATPASSWTTPATGKESSDDAASRIEGAHIAPGFTAAPAMRVRYDYRGRPMGAPFRRPTVNSSAPALSPTPAVQNSAAGSAANRSAGAAPAEATPAAEPVAPVANSLKSSAPAPAKPAPAKKVAPKKKQSDGWGTGTSGW